MNSHPSSSPIACQDCGNQAKKDCVHLRCRTCCKARGFACPTHVRSTWVATSRRRQPRQCCRPPGAMPPPPPRGREDRSVDANHPTDDEDVSGFLLHNAGGGSSPKSKRARVSLSLIDEAPRTAGSGLPGHGEPRGPAAGVTALGQSSGVVSPSHVSRASVLAGADGSEMDLASTLPQGFRPVEVHTEAMFKCVKLVNLASQQHEYAYRTVVEIGGHVFKGILYDQGPDVRPRSAHVSHLIEHVQPELQLASTSSTPLVEFEGLYGLGQYGPQ